MEIVIMRLKLIIIYCVLYTFIFTTPSVFCQAENLPLTISNISLDKKTFSTNSDTSVKISYTLSSDSLVSIKIYNENNILVRNLVQDEKNTKGSHIAQWDGKNDDMKQLPPGVYIYTIEARNEKGHKTIYDPADDTGGIRLKPRKSFLDTEKSEVSYILPKAGMVCIRAGIKDGPLMKTILEWSPREAGKNTEKWDGKDKSGLIDVFTIPEKVVYIFAYSIPDNSIILSSSKPYQVGLPNSFARQNLRPGKRIDPKTKYRHALHKENICHEPEFRIIFPSGYERTSQGVPILNGIVPVKIVVSENDRQHLESERFEVMFFVDTVFIFEDEEGFSPFTYMWNTEDISEGEHVLTVNILSYDDHCGVESRKIILRR